MTQVEKIKNQIDCDKAMAQIAKLKSKIQVISDKSEAKISEILPASVEQKIAGIRLKASEKQLPIQQEIQTLETAIADYLCDCADELFVDARSINLNNGKVGVRQSQSTELSETTLARIDGLKTQARTPEFNQIIGLPSCASAYEAESKVRELVNSAIKVTLSVKKDVVSKWHRSLLDFISARIKVVDRFWYKLSGDDSESTLREVER